MTKAVELFFVWGGGGGDQQEVKAVKDQLRSCIIELIDFLLFRKIITSNCQNEFI